MNTETESNVATAEAKPDCAPTGLLGGARPITLEDLLDEADRNYDLGRKHGIQECRPSLESRQRLLLKIVLQQRRIQELEAQLKQCSCWERFPGTEAA